MAWRKVVEPTTQRIGPTPSRKKLSIANQNDGTASVATITREASSPQKGPIVNTRPNLSRCAIDGAASAPHTMPTPYAPSVTPTADAVSPSRCTAYGTYTACNMKKPRLKNTAVAIIGRSKASRSTKRVPSRSSRRKWRCPVSVRGGSRNPASNATANAERPAAQQYAQPAPIQPTSMPPSAGPAEYATLRASSSRPFAAANDSRDTSDGTNDGAATLYATVPVAPRNPSAASQGNVNSCEITSNSTLSMAITRMPSASAIRVRRERRSAQTPSGIDSNRKGKVWAVCSKPVSRALAPSANTATSGAAARLIYSADCATRFDHASRWNAAGKRIADEDGEDDVADIDELLRLNVGRPSSPLWCCAALRFL